MSEWFRIRRATVEDYSEVAILKSRFMLEYGADPLLLDAALQPLPSCHYEEAMDKNDELRGRVLWLRRRWQLRLEEALDIKGVEGIYKGYIGFRVE